MVSLLIAIAIVLYTALIAWISFRLGVFATYEAFKDGKIKTGKEQTNERHFQFRSK